MKKMPRPQASKLSENPKKIQKTELDNHKFATHNFPSEIVEDILSRLSVKPLVRFTSLSKSWQKLLTTDSTFIQKHFTQTSQHETNHGFILQNRGLEFFYHLPNAQFENVLTLDSACTGPSEKAIVGSCNGLILLYNFLRYASPMYLWNPATRQCRTLPIPGTAIKSPSGGPSVGFGFVGDFKVVRLVPFGDMVNGIVRKGKVYVDVYSLNANCWRDVGVFGYSVTDYYSKSFVNGKVHWPANYGEKMVRYSYELILSFDMADEVFEEVLLPQDLDLSDVLSMTLRSFRGCLSMIVTVPGPDIQIWVMNDYGVRESWAKLFTLEGDDDCIHFPIEFLKNGELLTDMYECSDISVEYKNLVTYNFESREIVEHEILGAGRRKNWEAIPYVESLHSISQNEV